MEAVDADPIDWNSTNAVIAFQRARSSSTSAA
jgi:hypothetical protein